MDGTQTISHYLVLVIVAILLQILLYFKKDNLKYDNIIFLLNSVFALLIFYITFTALPLGYTFQKTLVLLRGLIGIGGIVLALIRKDLIFISKGMLSASIVLNLMNFIVGTF